MGVWELCRLWQRGWCQWHSIGNGSGSIGRRSCLERSLIHTFQWEWAGRLFHGSLRKFVHWQGQGVSTIAETLLVGGIWSGLKDTWKGGDKPCVTGDTSLVPRMRVRRKDVFSPPTQPGNEATGDISSEWTGIRRGVPQGSILVRYSLPYMLMTSPKLCVRAMCWWHHHVTSEQWCTWAGGRTGRWPGGCG